MRDHAARLVRTLLAATAVLLLAACATGFPGGYGQPGGYGGYGGQPGGYGGSPGYGSQRLVGTVQFLDPRSGQLVLVDERRGGYGQPDVSVWVDRNTRLFYQGREYPVSGLERGDVVSVDLVDDGRRLWARSIEVVRNVRDQYGGGYGGAYGDSRAPGGYGGPGYGGAGAETYGTALEGPIRYLEPGRRIIEINRGGVGGAFERIHYDAGTQFVYQGRPIRPEQLEVGDVIRVDAVRNGQEWLARAVTVTRSVRGV